MNTKPLGNNGAQLPRIGFGAMTLDGLYGQVSEEETGNELPTGWGFSLNINGSPGYVARALDASPSGSAQIISTFTTHTSPTRPCR